MINDLIYFCFRDGDKKNLKIQMHGSCKKNYVHQDKSGFFVYF